MLEFESKSQEVEEFLSAVPHWIVRYGILIIFLTIALVLCGAWWMQYPNVVTARVTVVTRNPPVSGVARSNGRLVMFAGENQHVRKGERVAALTNSANVEDVFALRKAIDGFDARAENAQAWARFPFKARRALGELQADYARFLRSVEDYTTFDRRQSLAAAKKSLETQVAQHRSLKEVLGRQKSLLAQEVELAEKKRSMYRSLHKEGLVSNEQALSIEGESLGKQNSLESADSSLIQNDVQLAQDEAQLTELERQDYERRMELLSSVRAAFDELKGRLVDWEEQSLLLAPAEGRVSYVKVWGDNQHVNAGNEVFVIVPSTHEIIGIVRLPQATSGKVEVGQAVRLKFDNFPYYDFGTVEAKVESISLIPREDQYLVQISFPRGLQTSYGKQLDFRQEMQGSAELIVDKARLTDRLFNPFRYMLRNAS